MLRNATYARPSAPLQGRARARPSVGARLARVTPAALPSGLSSPYFGVRGSKSPCLTTPCREAATSIAKIAGTIGRQAALGVGICSFAAWAGALAQAAGVSGLWTTEHGDAKIRIAACGQALCGTIVWLAQPVDSNGRAKTDVNNPEEAKRARPLVGLTILTGLTPSGETWRGVIYNSDDGRDYDVRITLLDERHAAIKGCVLGGLFCGGETWTRD